MAKGQPKKRKAMFTIHLHTDGEFAEWPLKYVEGETTVLSAANFADMGYEGLKEIVGKCSLFGLGKMFYCKRGLDLGLGLRVIKSTQDIRQMLKVGYESGNEIELYVEHFGNDIMEMVQNHLNKEQKMLTSPLRRLPTDERMSILMVGLDGAGKTTIMGSFGLDVWRCGSPGSHIESIMFNDIAIDSWDLSGEYATLDPPRQYFKATKGLIFVVDATDTERFDDARDQLHNILSNKVLHKDVPLLVYANKLDKRRGMKKEEIYERLRLPSPNGPRQHHVEFTCADTHEGLYEGLDWLCQRISFNCAITGEGVTKGLKLLRDAGAYKKYDDMPPGYTFQPTDEDLIDIVVKLMDKKEISPIRVTRANLFHGHPALVIRNHIEFGDLQPCMLGARKYYLFFCKVPSDVPSDEAYVEGYGYVQIKDQSNGVWLPTKYSGFFICNNESDNTSRWGEEQQFIYRPENQKNLSCWKMVMYGLADSPRPESNMVLCKVYEKMSKNAEKLKRVAKRRRKYEEDDRLWYAVSEKRRVLEESLRKMTIKEEKYMRKAGSSARRLLKEVLEYNRDEHNEADEIDGRRETAKRRKRKRD